MKVKEGFILRTVGTENVVAAVGAQSRKFNGIIRLNATAKFIWEHLQQETNIEELTEALTEAYDITKEQAEKDITAFVEKLKEASILD